MQAKNLSDVALWLSQAGALGLPYPQEDLVLMRQHTNDMLQEFSGLKATVLPTTDASGRPCRLLKLHGVVPMYHQGVKYNIPLAIWLVAGYPRETPLVFVEPTPDMMINPRHPFVDASGRVVSAYIRQWDPHTSNLLDLCADTSIQFGERPPLFAKAPQSLAQPSPQRQTPPPPPLLPTDRTPAAALRNSSLADDDASLAELLHANPMMRSPTRSAHTRHGDTSGVSGSLWEGAVQNSEQQKQQHKQRWQDWAQTPPPPPPPPPDAMTTRNDSNSSEALDGEFRSAALECLTRRLQATLESCGRDSASEVDSLLRIQGRLQHNCVLLQRAVDELARERAALECGVVEMSRLGRSVDSWLAINEKQIPQGELEAAEAVVPADVLCSQGLEGQADDMAAEDTMYAVERAFQTGALDVATYVRKVRLLCNKQFYSRVVCMKVAQAQHVQRATTPRRQPLHLSQQQQQQQQGRPLGTTLPRFPGGLSFGSTNSLGGTGGDGRGPERSPWPVESARAVEMQVGDSWTGITGANPLQPDVL